MSNVLVEENYLQDIANAIRTKNSKTDKYTPSQMADAISNIKATVTETEGDLQIVSSDAWSFKVTQTDHQIISFKPVAKFISKPNEKYSSTLDADVTVEPYTGYIPGTIKRSADTTFKVYNITASPAEEIAGMVENGWAKVYANNNFFYADEDYKNKIDTLVGNILVAGEEDIDPVSYGSNSLQNNSKLIKFKDTFTKKIKGKNYFYVCDSLATIDMPNLINASSFSLYSCSSLTTVNLPNLTSVGDDFLCSCSSLTTVNLSSLSSAGDELLGMCSSLISISLPKLTNSGYGLLTVCGALTSVDLPNLTNTGDNSFSNCSSLTTVNLPNLTSVGGGFLYDCDSLVSVDLPKLTSAGTYFLERCFKLKSVYLRSPNMCKLANPINKNNYSSTMSIYVPASLINDYKTDSNWSEIADHFKTLESIA